MLDTSTGVTLTLPDFRKETSNVKLISWYGLNVTNVAISLLSIGNLNNLSFINPSSSISSTFNSYFLRELIY